MAKTVLTYGTFDLFHVGHLRLLERSRALGDSLIVGVSTDEFNAVKGKKTVIDFSRRVEIVRSICYVDEVFPETSWEQKRGDVTKYGADIFAIGSDWTGKFDFLRDQCEVIYLPRTEGISTSNLKMLAAGCNRAEMQKMLCALENLAAALPNAPIGASKIRHPQMQFYDENRVTMLRLLHALEDRLS